MSLINLLSGQAADGVGQAVMVGMDEDNPGLARYVSVQGSGSWSGATVTLETSNDPDASPSEWTPMQKSDLTALEFTADFMLNVHLAPLVGLRARVADAGSPVPSLTVSAKGNIVTVG